jgi:hypothetical protein
MALFSRLRVLRRISAPSLCLPRFPSRPTRCTTVLAVRLAHGSPSHTAHTADRHPIFSAWLGIDEIQRTRRTQHLVELCECTAAATSTLTARDAVLLAHIIARSGRGVRTREWQPVWQGLSEAVQPLDMAHLKAYDLANLVWAYATVGHVDGALFDSVGTMAAGCTQELSATDLVTLLWSFAEVGRPSPPLFAAVANQIMERLEEFTPPQLATSIWSFAVTDQPSPTLFDSPAFADYMARHKWSGDKEVISTHAAAAAHTLPLPRTR